MKYCSNCGKEIIGESCPYCDNIINNLSTNNIKALKKGNTSLIIIIIPYIIGFICSIGGIFFGLMISDIFQLDFGTNFISCLQIILFYVSFMPIVFFPLLIISTILSIISLRKCYNTKAIIALILDILPIIIYSFIFLYTAS